MKNINYNILLFLLGLGFMVACSSTTDPAPTTTTNVTAVAITSGGPATIGTPYSLTATVTGGKTKTVTWSIKTAVTGVTIGGTNNDMLMTAATTQPGTVTVVATSTDDGATAGTKVTAEKAITLATASANATAQRTNADLQGMIVGSTGHFYAITKGAEKKMTIVLDDTTMELSHDATAGSDTELHFKTTDNRNTMVLNVPATGTPTVTSLNLMGHTNAVAAVTTVDHSTTTATTEVPLIFEGYETFYGTKRSNYETPFDPTGTPTQAQLDAKIELYRTHYNVVVKGGADAKLVVMTKPIATEEEKNRLKGKWEEEKIGYTHPFDVLSSSGHAKKQEYTITSRTDSKIEVSVTSPLTEGGTPITRTLAFILSTEGGKLKMKLPLHKSIEPVSFKDLTAEIRALKPLHVHIKKQGTSEEKFYKFADQASYDTFTKDPSNSYNHGISIPEESYNFIVSSLQGITTATEVTNSENAYVQQQEGEKNYKSYDSYQLSESELTEIK